MLVGVTVIYFNKDQRKTSIDTIVKEDLNFLRHATYIELPANGRIYSHHINQIRDRTSSDPITLGGQIANSDGTSLNASFNDTNLRYDKRLGNERVSDYKNVQSIPVVRDLANDQWSVNTMYRAAASDSDNGLPKYHFSSSDRSINDNSVPFGDKAEVDARMLVNYQDSAHNMALGADRVQEREKFWDNLKRYMGIELPTNSVVTSELRDHQGYRNAENVLRKCLQKYPNRSYSYLESITVRWSKNKDVLYCPTYKIASTFWRRVFIIQNQSGYHNVMNPYVIPADAELLAQKITIGSSIKPTFKFMFTRNPYTRLFSFYVDKLYSPNRYFWDAVGSKVDRLSTRGHAMQPRIYRRYIEWGTTCRFVTFSEFIKYVIYTLETSFDVDPHWVPIEQNCLPCRLKFDFIGRLESFTTDVEPVFEKLGLPNVAAFLKENGDSAADDDAINNTLNQVFESERLFFNNICTSLKTRMQRAWTILQMKGLIGSDQLVDDFIDLNRNTLYERAQKSRMLSTNSQRMALKKDAYKRLWSQISDSDLSKLKRLYAADFEMFGYDSKLNID